MEPPLDDTGVQGWCKLVPAKVVQQMSPYLTADDAPDQQVVQSLWLLLT
jgi:hypothetical protein